ncbi:uncharacterized protein LOC110706439 [Chenopodium quinoa]|uniref:uncharacterized protein LOC110706439 n=1 Tax=Chenopodium quinoa TaxID=63459 RepID=UPI000B795CCF|nr:uncharacterized protein LOC110706439 [Chenopodium quinoa]
MTPEQLKAAYEKVQADLEAARESNERLSKEKEASDSDAAALRQQLESAQSNRRRRPGQLDLIPRMPSFDVIESPHDTDTETSGEEMDVDPPIRNPGQGSIRTPGDDQGNPQPDRTEILLQRLVSLEKQNARVLSMMKKMPGVPIPVQREAPGGFAATPFCDELALARIPRRLSLPTFTSLYDGMTCPEQHVEYYKQRMWQASIPFECWEACMCKSFGATLTGPALKWLGKLEPGSITSFAMLVNKFYSHFESSRQFDKQTSDLYRIVQGPKETIRTYWSRFNKEKVSIKNVDNKTAIEAFLRGLHTDSDLYKDMIKYPCSTFEEVRTRAVAQMRFDEDIANRSSYPGSKSSSDRKAASNTRGSWRHQPYEATGKSRSVNAVQVEDILDAPQYPDISEYGFDVNIVAVVKELEPLGSKVRWPSKSNKPELEKDMSKWCEFHSDHGHKTEDCYALRREVAFQLKRGNLKHLLGKKKSSDAGRREPEKTTASGPPKPPVPKVIVNVITGGSDICGLTYSAAKRVAKSTIENAVVPDEIRDPLEKKLEAMSITFNDDDVNNISRDHEDSLVISLLVGNCLLRRVLVDGGSSANILFRRAMEDMGLKDSDITRRSTTLVGFSGESMSTLGDITLPTFAGGLNPQTKFNIVDCPSAYNAILGRPWIHRLKAIPSTYHQSIKFPTP